MAKAVVFDLDGTLIDSLPDIAFAFNQLLLENGRRQLPPEEVRVMVGDGAATLVRRGFEATGGVEADRLAALSERFVAIYEPISAERTRPWPGVVAALDALRAAGWRLAVCTNKPGGPTREILTSLGLAGYFGAVLGGDAVPFRKPDPRHVLATLEAAGAAAADAVFVGDSPNDINAAKAAGVPVIAVSFGYTRIAPAELGADRLIDHFDELVAAVEELSEAAKRDCQAQTARL